MRIVTDKLYCPHIALNILWKRAARGGRKERPRVKREAAGEKEGRGRKEKPWQKRKSKKNGDQDKCKDRKRIFQKKKKKQTDRKATKKCAIRLMIRNYIQLIHRVTRSIFFI